MIYFVRTTDDQSLIKIGTSIHLADRLQQLARESGKELRVLAVVDGGFERENELHKRFDHLRVVGEWFKPGRDLLDFIAAEGKDWDSSSDIGYIAVKIDRAVALDAKTVAMRRGISFAEYLTELLRAPVRRDVTKVARQIDGKGD